MPKNRLQVWHLQQHHFDGEAGIDAAIQQAHGVPHGVDCPHGCLRLDLCCKLLKLLQPVGMEGRNPAALRQQQHVAPPRLPHIQQRAWIRAVRCCVCIGKAPTSVGVQYHPQIFNSGGMSGECVRTLRHGGRPARPSAGEPRQQRRFVGRHLHVPRQRIDNLVDRYRPQRDLLAARPDRRQQRFGGVGGQDQPGRGRGFFQHLEQRIHGWFGGLIKGRQNRNAVARLKRVHSQQVLQSADFLYLDPAPLGCQDVQIGVLLALNQIADTAASTRWSRLRAQHRLSQPLGECSSADSFRPGDQDGMADTLMRDPPRQQIHGPLVADQTPVVHHGRYFSASRRISSRFLPTVLIRIKLWAASDCILCSCDERRSQWTFKRFSLAYERTMASFLARRCARQSLSVKLLLHTCWSYLRTRRRFWTGCWLTSITWPPLTRCFYWRSSGSSGPILCFSNTFPCRATSRRRSSAILSRKTS